MRAAIYAAFQRRQREDRSRIKCACAGAGGGQRMGHGRDLRRTRAVGSKRSAAGYQRRWRTSARTVAVRIAEGLTRLSRDQEHTTAPSSSGVLRGPVVTVAEGAAAKMSSRFQGSLSPVLKD